MPRTLFGRRGGFTLIEALVVLAIVGIAALILIPATQKFMHRSRMEGFARQVAMVCNEARLEAIRRGVDVVVRIDTTDNDVVAFADVDGPNAGDPPDKIYNPVGGVSDPKRTDYEVARLHIPGDVQRIAPGTLNTEDGFTTDPLGTTQGIAVFQSSGGVIDEGAFRFGDAVKNFLEVRIAPAPTARITLRKWNPNLAVNPDDPDENNHWYEPGEGGKSWEWN